MHSYSPQLQDRIIRIRELEQRPSTPSGTRQWKVSVSCGTYHSVINLTDPFSPSQETRLQWALEEHPTHHPFETCKSSAISKELWGYSMSLMDQLNLHEVLTYPYPEDAIPRRSTGSRNRVKPGVEAAEDIKARRWYVDIEMCWGGIDESMIQGLHWEALENPEIWPTQMRPCLTVRRKVSSTDILTHGPIIAIRSDTFRILLVVGYSLSQAAPTRIGGGKVTNPRLISRPLVEIIEQLTKGMSGGVAPIQLEIVRPGTWKSLQNHLRRRDKGYYHLVHFDVHGKVTYDRATKQDFVSLAFVSDNSPKKRSWRCAKEVSALLTTHGVKLVMLNAERSAKAFGVCEANIAEILIRGGVRAVVAFPYKVLNAGTEVLMSAFYKSFLTETWDLAVALSEARKVMMEVQLREGRFGIKVPIDDWIIPVLYHNGGTEVSVLGDDIGGDLSPMKASSKSIFSKLHGLRQANNPDSILSTLEVAEREQRGSKSMMSHGEIVGRDGDIFNIEMMLDTSILRVVGPPGIGKSTLVMHLGWWWKATSLVQNYFYFDFYERPHLNAEMITRQLYLCLFPPSTDSGSLPKVVRNRSPMRGVLLQHLSRSRSPSSRSSSPAPAEAEIFPEDWAQKTLDKLREVPYLLVLDSLESSYASTKHDERLKGEINEFLASLQGGSTVVLIVSNKQECWLNDSIVNFGTYHLKKLGMTRAIELAARAMRRSGGDFNRFRGIENQKYLQKLMKLSEMNPLVMDLTMPNIAIYNDSPQAIFLGLLQGAIPLEISDTASGHSIKAMRNMANLLEGFDKDSKRLLLCLTPFWSRLPKDIDPYIHSLLYHKALPSTTEVEHFTSSRKPSEWEQQRAKSIISATGLLTRYGYILRDLLSLELLSDGDIADASDPSSMPCPQYYRIHPLLTLFLRQTAVKEQASPNPVIANYSSITSAFLDYYTQRSAQWAKHPDNTYESAAQEIRDEEINFLSAISIPLQSGPDKTFDIFPLHAYTRFASMSLVDKSLSSNASLVAHFSELILQRFNVLRSRRGDSNMREVAVEIALFASNWLCEYHSENSPVSVFRRQIEKSIEFMKLANTISPSCQETLAMLEEQATKQKSAAVSGGMIDGLRLRKPWNGLMINSVSRETLEMSKTNDDPDGAWLRLAMTFSRLQSVAVQAPVAARFSPALSQQLRKDLLIIWHECVDFTMGTDLEPFLSSYEWVTQVLEDPAPMGFEDPIEAKKVHIPSARFLGYPEFVRSQLMLQLRDTVSAKKYLLDGLQRARNKSNQVAEILLHIRLCDLTFELRNWNECISHAEWVRAIMVQLGEDLSTDDFKAFAQATWRKGICHNHLHQWEAALEAFYEALGVCKHIHDRVMEYAILRKLAAIKRESGLGEMTVTDALLKALAIAYDPALSHELAVVSERGMLLQRIISAMMGRKAGESGQSVMARLACARDTSVKEMHEFIDELMIREKERVAKDARKGIPSYKTDLKLTMLYAEAERIMFDSPKALMQQPLKMFAGSKWEGGLLNKRNSL